MPNRIVKKNAVLGLREDRSTNSPGHTMPATAKADRDKVPTCPVDAAKPSHHPVTEDDAGSTRPPRLGLVSMSVPLARRTVRRAQLRDIVPLADTTIYEMEQRGEFPRRFYLTPRCVVWDLGEVESWIVARREASDATNITRAPTPDVWRRRARPVKR